MAVILTPPLQKTSDINVLATRVLPSPSRLLKALPKTSAQAKFVGLARRQIHRIVFGDDRRFLSDCRALLNPNVNAGARIRQPAFGHWPGMFQTG